MLRPCVQLHSAAGCNAKLSTAVLLWTGVGGGKGMKDTLFRIGAFYLFVCALFYITDVLYNNSCCLCYWLGLDSQICNTKNRRVSNFWGDPAVMCGLAPRTVVDMDRRFWGTSTYSLILYFEYSENRLFRKIVTRVPTMLTAKIGSDVNDFIWNAYRNEWYTKDSGLLWCYAM